MTDNPTPPRRGGDPIDRNRSSVLPDYDRRTAARMLALAALEPGGGEMWGALRIAVGDLNMVTPFDWPAWKEPWPEAADDVSDLDEELVSKHMTRIVRSDRFIEGNFEGAVRTGLVSWLVLRWLEITAPTGSPG